MKALHVPTRVSIGILFGFFLALQAPGSARGAARSDQILTGELVVTNAARHQFRLVEHHGFFTAPPGTALEALDGKPVQVELGRDRRVLQISEVPIRLEPITHGFDVISGELLLRDPVTGAFAIAGDDHNYIAPQGIDVRPYAGRLVEMRLDEQGRVMNINLIARSADAPMPRPLLRCMDGDASIASGLAICRSGRTFRCSDGVWVDAGTLCTQ